MLSCGAQTRRGEVVYQNNFDDPALQVPASAAIHLDQGLNGSQALMTERPVEAGPGDVIWRVPLDLNRLRGVKVKCEAQVKAQDVSLPPNPWNGVKFMLQAGSAGKMIYPQQNEVRGSFDWKTISFTATIPADATEASLLLGLEKTTGKAWFDDVKITALSIPRHRPGQSTTGPVFTGHEVPRLRGAMVSPTIKEADLRVLGGDWKANHLRWQLTWLNKEFDGGDIDTPEAYDRWIDLSLSRLDALLPVARELGMLVTIDLHSTPGGSQGRINRIFSDKKWQDEFIKTWDKIARHYNGNPTIWGYDLANEPIEVWGNVDAVPEGLMDWHELATKTSQVVRAIDAKHAIIIEPTPGGDPGGFNELEPIPVPGIVYSVHMYKPHEFTHQGVGGYAKGPVYYPGEAAGAKWDKEALRRALQPVRDFQRDYNVQIYVGEFSAIRWAPDDSAYNYLRDCIDIFEEYGWDWNYHAFREYNGWSVEHGQDPADAAKRVTEPTKREQLLLSWFAKNEKAGSEQK
jgi:hypothetical protein